MRHVQAPAGADYRLAALGELPLLGGGVLENAQLAYKVFGELDSGRPAIVYPTSFGTHHSDLEWLVGPEQALDPQRYTIVMINLFGSGLSSSPSNHAQGPASFPHATMQDNVNAQHRLLTEILGIRRIALAVGFSMGAQAAYHWGALFPDMVERIAPICGSARTSPHNFVFLEGVKAALTGDPAWRGDIFTECPTVGFRSMGRVYAGWAFSQAFYREETYRTLGYASLEDFLVRDWDERFSRRDGNDLVAMIRTWQQADISTGPTFRGNLNEALKAISARALVMPSASDLYFPVEDSRAEVEAMRSATLLPIPTKWGHRVNVPGQNPKDAAFIDAALRKFLSD
ncbi:alpha/beta fold hydrolase [Bosea sp. BIWAKO-01]|uniref:alpha/beta fold hydrolase n=1 Tax=Bosea sp. BIWAKO-01 TaxID=506668 RepID=UPI000853771E|nr:alpha/beta fold hydrolase [Bosea sp. BIWAKO-01]